MKEFDKLSQINESYSKDIYFIADADNGILVHLGTVALSTDICYIESLSVEDGDITMSKFKDICKTFKPDHIEFGMPGFIDFSDEFCSLLTKKGVKQITDSTFSFSINCSPSNYALLPLKDWIVFEVVSNPDMNLSEIISMAKSRKGHRMFFTTNYCDDKSFNILASSNIEVTIHPFMIHDLSVYIGAIFNTKSNNTRFYPFETGFGPYFFTNEEWVKICNICNKYFHRGHNIRQRDWPGFEREMIEAGFEEYL